MPDSATCTVKVKTRGTREPLGGISLFWFGAGSALMHAILGAADALGEPLVTLLGDPAYYRRFGFELSSVYQITPPVPHWQPHFQVRVLSEYQPRLRGMSTYPEPSDWT